MKLTVTIVIHKEIQLNDKINKKEFSYGILKATGCPVTITCHLTHKKKKQKKTLELHVTTPHTQYFVFNCYKSNLYTCLFVLQ